VTQEDGRLSGPDEMGTLQPWYEDLNMRRVETGIGFVCALLTLLNKHFWARDLLYYTICMYCFIMNNQRHCWVFCKLIFLNLFKFLVFLNESPSIFFFPLRWWANQPRRLSSQSLLIQ
jgi:hypothetical protein